MDAKPTILLLPGMDGTGRLFRWLTRAIESAATPHIVSYPTDRFLTLEQLADHVATRLPAGRHALVAESFSGPLALALASTASSDLRGIVLSTSFVTRPGPRWLAALPLGLLLRVPPPAAVVSRLLLDGAVEGEVVSEVQAAIRSVPAPILAARLRQLLRIDARDALRACSVPVAYLVATRDRLIGTRGLAAARQARPSIDSAVIEGPHLLLQARPVEAASVIAGYLRKWFAR